MIKDKLFWEKYRPNTLIKESGKIKMFLLPRIEKFIKDGIKTNMIFYGSAGIGKTTLAKILTEGTNCLKINCSLENGIDTVRKKIDDHCTTYGLLGNKGMKTVWLEEFDGTTRQFREGLRGFIEEHSDNVRFVATANSMSKFQRDETGMAILSRFNVINFEPLNSDESQFIRKSQLSFLKTVAKSEKIEINDQILENIINSNFPDFRSSIQDLQEVSIIGDYEILKEQKNSTNLELYDYILDNDNNVGQNYYLVLDNYRDKTDVLLKLLGRPFFKYLLEKDSTLAIKKGQEFIKLCKEYNAEYDQTLDPEIHLVSFITELKNIMNN